jgi:predicted PurR-regulated permease PerM
MRDTKLIVIFLGLLAFIAVGFVLHILGPLLVPFVVAAFLSRIFSPLVASLRRRRVPAPLAILLVLVLVSIVIGFFSVVLYSSAQSFTEAMPRYQVRLKGLLAGSSAWLASVFPWLQSQIQHYQWDKAVEISSVTGVVAGMVGSFLVLFNDAFLVMLFLVFLLSGSEAFPEKLRRAFAADQAERLGTVMHDIEEEIRRYLLMKTVFNLILGIAVAILLAAFGVDFPLFWGLVTFLAHYIPSLGAILSVALPTVFLFLQFSPGMALLISLLNAGLQFAAGNVAEPRVMGESLNLSTLVVLLSLIFWGWLWGPWGMVLAVPLTSTIKIVCEHVGPLRPLAVLMSGSVEPLKPQTSPARNTDAGATRIPSGLT